MTDKKDRHDATYVPPPYPQKPKASHDNAVELAAGGKAEQDALAARDERLARQPDLPQQPADRPVSRETLAEQRAATETAGRTDSPEGTGVGYAGEGGASYGTQGATGAADRLTDAPETTGRQAEMHTGDTRRTIDTARATRDYPQQEQEEVQHMERPASPDKQGTTQQSTGSATPSQGTGSTPQAHEEHGAGQAAQPGGGNRPGTGGGTAATGGTQSVQGGAGTIGGGKAESATAAAKESLEAARGHIDETGKGIQRGVGDPGESAKETAQPAISNAARSAQDTLKSVQATVQSKSDQMKETVAGKTDQVRNVLNERTEQWKSAAGERGEQAKTAADEKATQAGERLTELASTLREKTQTLGADSPVAEVASRAAGALEQTGSYLTESTPDDWVGDLKQLISRKPLEAVLAAAAIGYLAARAFRK